MLLNVQSVQMHENALYLYTSAYSLWAETLHGICDLTNQGLLFLSIRLASTDPDFNHPYGYGASRWVVSFLSGIHFIGFLYIMH